MCWVLKLVINMNASELSEGRLLFATLEYLNGM